jgi:hypothetical protein
MCPVGWRLVGQRGQSGLGGPRSPQSTTAPIGRQRESLPAEDLGALIRVNSSRAIAADRDEDARIIELRVYYSGWPLKGGHSIRPPLLQPDPDLQESDIIGEYQAALAALHHSACEASTGFGCTPT